MYYPGETYINQTLVKDSAGTLTDPTSITIAIAKPDGTSALSATAMTKDSTGTYHYDYSIASDAATGIWEATITIVSGTRTAKSKIQFGVEWPCASDVWDEYLIGYNTDDIADAVVQKYLERITGEVQDAVARFLTISTLTLDSSIRNKAIMIGTAALSLKTLRNKGAAQGRIAQQIAVSQATADEYWTEYQRMLAGIRMGTIYGA